MKPLRFVLLRHEHQGVHYDLMFETGPVLRTWKLGRPLAIGIQPAELSFDHRTIYLDYEGSISGDRGVVSRWDSGSYEGGMSGSPPFRLVLNGQKLKGELTLRQVGANWEARFLATDNQQPRR